MRRRDFLSFITTAAAAPAVMAGAARGLRAAPPPSDRITMGFIGVGVRGGDGLVTQFLKLADCQCVATCDPFKWRREAWAKRIDATYAERAGADSYHSCDTYDDFRELLQRKDIDAVGIATPDHWHVPIALAAIAAGKDVYVEKPLGVSVNQNRALRAAINRKQRVFQYGTQQRSIEHVRFGCELVRNGRIGKVHTVEVLAPCGQPGGLAEPMPVPKGFNYDMWLGPAPVKPYTQDRCIGSGRYFIYDYSLGFVAGWGAHPLDVLQWGLGTDGTSPIEYQGVGSIPHEGLFDTITRWTVRAKYANGVVLDFLDDHHDLTKFIGTEGWVAISRKEIDAEPASLLKSEIGPGEVHLHESDNHYQDFLNSIRNRKPTVNPIESAVRSDTISQLSDIAIRTGRKIQWDPEKEQIVGDDDAAKMLDRPMRQPWHL